NLRQLLRSLDDGHRLPPWLSEAIAGAPSRWSPAAHPHSDPPPSSRVIAYVHEGPRSHCLCPLAPRRGGRAGVRGAATGSGLLQWRFVVLRDPLTPTLSVRHEGVKHQWKKDPSG